MRVDRTGELESKDLAKWAMELFPDKHVTPVDEETHQQWAMTDVSRPKVLLFTDKEEPPALYRALASNLQKLSMDFGMASGAGEEFKKRFNVVRVRAAGQWGRRTAGSGRRRLDARGSSPLLGAGIPALIDIICAASHGRRRPTSWPPWDSRRLTRRAPTASRACCCPCSPTAGE